MTRTIAPDFDAPSAKVPSPASLAHVVLRTAKFAQMVEFYTTFLGGTITHGNDFVCFITYDSEHHRIAILAVPGTGPKNPTSSGLEHISFAYDSMADLLLAYRHRQQRDIFPAWSVNHGPTTSIYYKDPDGNMLETQVDNFDTVKEANDFMMGSAFAENAIGTDVDPEQLIERLRGGESEEVLKKRVEIGPRALPDFEAM